MKKFTPDEFKSMVIKTKEAQASNENKIEVKAQFKTKTNFKEFFNNAHERLKKRSMTKDIKAPAKQPLQHNFTPEQLSGTLSSFISTVQKRVKAKELKEE